MASETKQLPTVQKMLERAQKEAQLNVVQGLTHAERALSNVAASMVSAHKFAKTPVSDKIESDLSTVASLRQSLDEIISSLSNALDVQKLSETSDDLETSLTD